MPSSGTEFLTLLWGTVLYRPYVYAFFVCFLILGGLHLGWKRLTTFTIVSFLIAFVCEYSATHGGFPFGPYTYIETTRHQELWLFNVPFWDSLSFVFLSYFSMVLAAAVLDQIKRPTSTLSTKQLRTGLLNPWTPFLGGLLMTLLDFVIDPTTLQGDRWFLGQVYTYPHHGFFFGVTAANFAGWFFVGMSTQLTFQLFLRFAPWCQAEWRPLPKLWLPGVFFLYSSVFLFMFGVIIYLNDWPLALASFALIGITLGVVYKQIRRPLLGIQS